MGKLLIEDCRRIYVGDIVRQSTASKENLLSATIDANYEVSGHKFMTAIMLGSHKCHFGGFRLYFLCTHCKKRVSHLYLPDGCELYRCRYCHNLAYLTQNRHRNKWWEHRDKYERKRNKLMKRFDNKYLRTPTMERLGDEIAQLMYMERMGERQILHSFLSRFR